MFLLAGAAIVLSSVTTTVSRTLGPTEGEGMLTKWTRVITDYSVLSDYYWSEQSRDAGIVLNFVFVL